MSEASMTPEEAQIVADLVPTPPNCIHPKLMRLSILSQIGEDCPFRTIKAAADHYGIHPEQLRLYVHGQRPLEPKLAKAFGVVPVTFYLPMNAIETGAHREKQDER